MIILCYHDLSSTSVNNWTMQPETFRNQLRILKRRGYRCILPDAIDSLSLVDDRCAIVSFDDGRRGCAEYAAGILDEFEYVGVFYISTNFTDGICVPQRESYTGFMDWPEIRKLSQQGHAIGSHAVTHTRFHNLSSAVRLRELQESKDRIEQNVGVVCRHFAAPYGDLDRATSSIANDLGYATCATTVFGINRSLSMICRLRRWEVGATCGAIQFGQALSQLEAAHRYYRVAILPPETSLGEGCTWPVSRLAEFDFVLTSSSGIHELLSAYNIICLDSTCLSDAMLLNGDDDATLNNTDLQDSIRESGGIPSDAGLWIEICR